MVSAEEIEKIVVRNERVCLAFRFMQSIFLGGSVMTTYYLDRGLTQTQVFILQTVLAVVSVVSDLPFGSLSDHKGTRKVLIIGSMILVCQSVVFSVCTTFWQFVLALVGTGLYLAALSNTTNAAMSLTYKLGNYDQMTYVAYQARSSKYGISGYVIGMVVGGHLATFDLSWPYRLQPIISAACLIIAFGLVEPGIRAVHADKGLIVKSLRTMLIDRRDIRYMICIQSGFYLYISLMVWVLQPRMDQVGIERWAYSVVYVAWAAGVFMVSDYGDDRKASESHDIWLVLVIGSSVCALAAGLLGSVLGFAALMVGLTLVSGFASRLFNSYLDEVLPPEGLARNTELAVGSTIPTLVFAVAAPFFGMLIDATSLSTAITVMAVCCSVVTCGGYFLFRRELKR